MFISKMLRAADHPYITGKGGRLVGGDVKNNGILARRLKGGGLLGPLRNSYFFYFLGRTKGFWADCKLVKPQKIFDIFLRGGGAIIIFWFKPNHTCRINLYEMYIFGIIEIIIQQHKQTIEYHIKIKDDYPKKIRGTKNGMGARHVLLQFSMSNV